MNKLKRDKKFAIHLSKGFTLMELLVVAAIIGILVAVTMTAVFPALLKGGDAAIKGDLEAVRTSAVIEFLTLGRKFSTTGTAISGDCATMTTAGTIFANTNIHAALLDIKSQNGGVALTCNIPANGSSYVVAVTLNTPNRYWCIDSTGASRDFYGAVTSQFYTGQTGSGNFAIDTATNTYACNI